MTNSTGSTMTAADALKYAAAILKLRTDWATDSLGGTDCNGDHELECDAIREAVFEITTLAARFGDPHRYSNGRLVKSTAEIQHGLTTEHVWNPDPAAELPCSWRSVLPSDPGEPSPGLFEVSLEPASQDIHVRVVRTV